MRLGIPVYEGVNLLDVAGPVEMFHWAGTIAPLQTVLISEHGGSVMTNSNVRFEAHASFAETPSLDILWVPGGDPVALGRMMSNPDHPYLRYLRLMAENAQWVCSVCEGALLLARAGLLDGYKATTHWAFVACLQSFPEIDVDVTNPRFVVSGDRLTGGGVSSGLDEALQLILMLFGEDAAKNVQTQTQYFPKPPVDAPFPGPPAPACVVRW
jgi:cyclohexyl-isocyanide hydratase